MRSKLIKLSASICWINPYKQVGRGALGNAVSAVHVDTASVQYSMRLYAGEAVRSDNCLSTYLIEPTVY